MVKEHPQTEDRWELARFLQAQDGSYEQARRELQAGRKRSHWMWFIFPQLRGLGSSSMAERYGISCREEAEAYLAHPVLGQRLRELTGIVAAHSSSSLETIFGYPDDLKFCSCMTLFAAVAEQGDEIFSKALRTHCKAEDPETLRRLS